MINNQLDFKLGQFIQEQLDVVPAKIKIRKSADLNEMPLE